MANTLVYMPKIDKAQMDSRIQKNKKKKTKYAVLYEVQKVVKVTSPEQAKAAGLDDSMELIERRRFNSVNPRHAQKYMQPSIFINGLNPAEIKKTFHKKMNHDVANVSALTFSKQPRSSVTPRIEERLRSKRFPIANRRNTVESEEPMST